MEEKVGMTAELYGRDGLLDGEVAPREVSKSMPRAVHILIILLLVMPIIITHYSPHRFTA